MGYRTFREYKGSTYTDPGTDVRSLLQAQRAHDKHRNARRKPDHPNKFLRFFGYYA